MQRISPKPLKEYPWYVRVIFSLQKRRYGAILESAKLWARSSLIFAGLSAFYGAINRNSSPIPPRLRSLISVEIAKILECPFCVDINSATFLKLGEQRKFLEELKEFKQSDTFTKKEKAALDYAKAMTFTPNRVTDEIFDELKTHFYDDEIIELTSLIAFQNCSSRFNTALRIPSQGFSE